MAKDRFFVNFTGTIEICSRRKLINLSPERYNPFGASGAHEPSRPAVSIPSRPRKVEAGPLKTVMEIRRQVGSPTRPAKDSLSRGHSDRMAEYAVQLGEVLGMQEQGLEEIQIACRFMTLTRSRCRTASF